MPPERLAYTQGSPEDPEQFDTMVSFLEVGGKTRVTMRMLFPREKALKDAREFGAPEGAEQTLSQLADQVETL